MGQVVTEMDYVEIAETWVPVVKLVAVAAVAEVSLGVVLDIVVKVGVAVASSRVVVVSMVNWVRLVLVVSS
jgi:hypothetical protein